MSDEQRLDEARDAIISAIAQTMVIYGVTPSVGRIYGVLYFATEPLSLDEIKDQVAMSKASVSHGIRELLETDMVTKVWKKGDRKDHYIAEKDFLRNFIHFLVKKIRQERNIIHKAYVQTKPLLEELAHSSKDQKVKDSAVKDLEYIDNLENYLKWTMQLANTMESGEIFKHFPKH
ncbi:GbsR/MarR family transcriptional regulator [Bacillus pinisoli]|uniref:GbsR/MarR family transcriptional regulator n=1 Tax=Bacillus pinisoli TaxID=2901866 RepID=UPI001FF1A219|nr:transcriptional regulator [Bacillus pinisoli]